jgi:hypothetical protein
MQRRDASKCPGRPGNTWSPPRDVDNVIECGWSDRRREQGRLNDVTLAVTPNPTAHVFSEVNLAAQ